MQKKSSWDKSERWYDSLVGEKGHYYHQSVIFPSSLNLLEIEPTTKGSLLDLGCGNGVLAHHTPKGISYTGVDIAKKLLEKAPREKGEFIVADATAKLPLKKTDFDYGCFILSLQNMENGQGAIKQAAHHLKKGSSLLIVLNHPCFRIPRQSSWGIDESAKLQYRKVNLYMSSLEIPIQMHPGKKGSEETLSFHHPLSTYVSWLGENGFLIHKMQELCSDKKSEGKMAKMEDRARREFPLFLTLLAKKLG